MAEMTWKDLQIICLQKIFEIKGDELTQDSNTQPYIKSMPAAANEAMMKLATAGREFIKHTTIRPGETPISETLGGYAVYDLKSLVGDFYHIDKVMIADDETYGRYNRYKLEGDRYFVIPMNEKGDIRIWYAAYPTTITKYTEDDAEIDLHPEEANMIALYMAGQLYKDDDISIAQIYMNEFSTWLEELKISGKKAKSSNSGNGSGGGWTSEKGWY